MAGTTVRDDGQVPAAFTAALEAHGLAVTPATLADVRGASKREAVRRFVPEGPGRDARAARVYDAFREDLAARYRRDGVEPVAGAAEVFSWLRGRGARVALTTGFDRDVTRLLLDALGWSAGAVDAVVCGDDVPEGRPAPFLLHRAMERTGVAAPSAVAAVGDTALDLEAGARAGVRWNVGVLSGAHPGPRLEAAPHTHILASVAELPGLWRG